ncbi:septum site-determining protein MinC [Thaumasiovibrio subtropicus]|uniref:septum site-determining protein MinC n=1 Tax=Thaumasiovibrio subtropicus TaxID=1891207 RepID=UPI000B362605|nr:septum site-determining protein MinC [Thaumasiovibrio subtropicus]
MSKIAELKGSSFTLSVLRLFDKDETAIRDFLAEKVTQAPAFFASAPVIIDISQCHEDLNFPAIKAAVLEAGMIPVGVSGCPASLRPKVKEAQLALMTAAKEPASKAPQLAPTKVISTPVRSGQQIYAKNSDLVILNHVSAGAEVIADGSIHIYGTLRGRAIAGASGQQEANIFCQNLQPELVSISGNYWLSDKINSEQWGASVKISLNEENLHIAPLSV